MVEPELTHLDESFSHQLVAPRAITAHNEDRWAERAYYLVHVHPGLTINLGRQLYRNAGYWRTFAAAATAGEQHCLRRNTPFNLDDDPDQKVIGPLKLEVIEPMKKIRLNLDDPDSIIKYDLTFEARFPPVLSDTTRVEQGGVVVTDTTSFFQSGDFSGTVQIGDDIHRLERRAGFRDRSWGVRKHDGSPKRGLVLFFGCELPERSIYALILETASGRRVFTNGWVVDRQGVTDRVVDIDHDLKFRDGLVSQGRLALTLESQVKETVEFEVENRLFLAGVGYSPDPERSADGVETFDLNDAEVIADIDGQNDNGTRFRSGDQAGWGYVETGIGVHARYRPST